MLQTTTVQGNPSDYGGNSRNLKYWESEHEWDVIPLCLSIFCMPCITGISMNTG